MRIVKVLEVQYSSTPEGPWREPVFSGISYEEPRDWGAPKRTPHDQAGALAYIRNRVIECVAPEADESPRFEWRPDPASNEAPGETTKNT